MAEASDQATSICSHCDRAILTSNLDLHVAHCSRNLEKCKICAEMVPKRHAEEHFLRTHAPVACSLCGGKMEREVLAVHKGENCPQRIVACDYCEFPLPAIDLFEHQEVCGNRTELCHLCNRYIRLRERDSHESRCNGGTNNIAESSRVIPSPNPNLHVAHCSRKLEKCKICGDMVPGRDAEEHFLRTHAPVACSLCSKTMELEVACSLCSETVEREVLAVHKGENCPQRIVTCEYCEFPLPAIDLFKHQEVCGNRTELCHLCSRYIRLNERDGHESRCNGGTNNIAESSSFQVACSLCSKTMELEVLAVHKRENCSQRIVTCEYCEFSLTAIDLFKHQEVCGNRTERCHLCSRYIRLCDRNAHESRCNGGTNNIAESSRNTIPAERDRSAPRKQPHEVKKMQLLFTIAVTGIAVLFGSLIFQRKAEDSRVR